MANLLPKDALRVKLNSFVTPACVWATEELHEGMSEERKDLYRLEVKLCEFLKKRDNRPSDSDHLEVDRVVAVRSTHDERLWHRGKIECCYQLLTGNKYNVRLLDLGTLISVKPKQLRKIPFNCDSVPPQAMLLILEGIVPMSMGISFNYDSVKPEICQGWTAAAERYIEDKILKAYDKAYFVEGSRPRMGQHRFGDLLLTMDNREEPVHLKQLLCEAGHAVDSKEEFQKRLPGPSDEICRSPLEIGSTTDTMSSCPPSPAVAMMLDDKSPRNAPAKKHMSISEFKEKMERERNTLNPSEVPVISQEPSQPSIEPPKPSIEPSQPSTDPPKNSNFARLNKLKKLMSSAPPASDPTPAPSLMVPIPLNMPPKDLGSDFVPAGRSIKMEKKPDGNSYHSQRTSKWTNGNSDHKSDSSLSDGITRRSGMHLRPSSHPNSRSDGPACGSRSSTFDSNYGNTSDSNGPVPNHSDSKNPVPNPLTSKRPVLNQLALLKASVSKTEEPAATKTVCSSSFTSNSEEPISSKTSNAIPLPMKERLMRPDRSQIYEDSMKEEDYLARSILLHGGNPPTPWMTYSNLKGTFSTHIEQFLINERWCYNLLTIEKFMWPAITQRQNVVMVSPKRSGKTTSYVVPLMDFMIDLEQTPKGNGPLVLILCAGSKTASDIHSECVKLVNGVKNAPRVHYASGLALNQQFFLKMVNGCEVFITTPPCFLRILKEYKHTYALNLDRLQHYVLDGADVLMTRFLNQITEIQSLVLAEQTKRAESMDEKIQIVVASEKWVPELLSFSTNLCGNPLVCINDCFEACIYGKVEVVCRLTQPDTKPRNLLKILEEFAGHHKVVVFCSEAEVFQLQEYLGASSLNLIAVTPGATAIELQNIRHSWDSSSDGHHYVLLCADSEFEDLKCKDATYVIHYSLPYKDRTCFVKRLSAISSNISNIFNRKPRIKTPSVQLLVDETNTDQFPVIVQLMHRISDKIDNKLLEASKTEVERKERQTKGNKLFCTNLKMFGNCQRDLCPNRHVYIQELDESNHLPQSGVVSMYVKQVHSAGHFSVRLTKQRSHDYVEEDEAGQYLKLPMEMSLHFSKERTLVGDVNIGDICAMESVEGLYNRVRIIEVLEKNKHGNPLKVLVQFIDEGNVANARVYMLYSLPEELKNVPPQVVDVFLCGLLPADMDEDYCSHATTSIQKLVNSTQKQDSQRFFEGKVVMSMTGSLWVDPLNIIEWLPHTQTHVVRQNIKESLLNEHHALENPEHMSVLFKMCGKYESALVSVPGRSCAAKPKAQPKPDWAFLESDVFEDVEFICAYEDCTIYVKKTKFSKLLSNLMDDIDKEYIKRKTDEVAALSEGDFCLSKYQNESKWFRARILSKNDDKSFSVFYVDFGDKEKVSLEQLNTIPDWAITRLPFQAIECSLAGVSSCDSVDRFYDAADGKNLLAQVCDRREAAQNTGGHHYVIAVVDYSNPHEPSILNKDILKHDGVQACEDQLKHLDFEIDRSLFNSNESQTSEEFEDIDEELNLSDLEFSDGDLDAFIDDEEDLQYFVEGFRQANPDVQKLLESEAAKQLAVCPQPAPADIASVSEKINEGASKALNEHEDVVQNEVKGPSDWEEEVEYIGRSMLPDLCSARPPRTKWLEDLYYVWIKFCITGVEKYFLCCTCDRIQFSTFVGGRYYHLDQLLRGVVIPGSAKSAVKGFTVEVKLKKACSGVMWERLFAKYRRYPWLSRDLEAFAAESTDSECEFSLEALNREIRKMPVKQRRKRHNKDMMEKPNYKLDISSDSADSNCDYEMVDSDEMF